MSKAALKWKPNKHGFLRALYPKRIGFILPHSSKTRSQLDAIIYSALQKGRIIHVGFYKQNARDVAKQFRQFGWSASARKTLVKVKLYKKIVAEIDVHTIDDSKCNL